MIIFVLKALDRATTAGEVIMETREYAEQAELEILDEGIDSREELNACCASAMSRSSS